MNCLICVGVAKHIRCEGPWEERNCHECGRYRISNELIFALMDQGQIFDISRTRRWLSSRREESCVPTIGGNDVIMSRLLVRDR